MQASAAPTPDLRARRHRASPVAYRARSLWRSRLAATPVPAVAALDAPAVVPARRPRASESAPHDVPTRVGRLRERAR